MNLELWQILGNQEFDDAFYADMLLRSHADTDTDVSAHRQVDDSVDALTMP